MSAIYGLVHLDGRPTARPELDLMGIALAAHGPDGNGVWAGDHVGLGQRLMCFTPEDRLERQPLIGAEGHHVLVADGRIDNRTELIHELGIPSPEASGMPDSAFILHSYQKWGLECASHLIGDFVFALCDLPGRHVLIARSPMSSHSLYYHTASAIFAFASAPKGLFALPWIPREIDQQRLADYLVWAPRETGRTFFAGVRELPAGHSVVVRREGSRLQQHWRPDLGRETRFPRDADYVEAFNVLFDRVIADNLRSLSPVGVMMSGGLDSSSVAVTAARLLSPRGERLATFTQVPRAGFELAPGGGQYADETPLVRAIGREYRNMDLNFVRTDNCFFLDGIDLFFTALECPFRSVWNRVWWEAILREASHRNLRVLLTGIPGNFTISRAGDLLLAQLIRRGKWIRAFREAQSFARQTGGTSSALRVLARGAAPLLPTPLWLAAGRLLRRGNPVFRANPLWRFSSAIHPEFARLHRVTERAGQKGHDFYSRGGSGTPADRYRFLRSYDSGILVNRGYEALFGIQTRNPTADVRVVGFCLSVPEEQFQKNGISRSLIRRSMEDRLPREVLANQRRGVQAADWFEQVSANRSRMLDELTRIETCDLAARAIDLKRVRQLLWQMPELGAGTQSIPPIYREILGSAFMTGRFLCWFESSSGGGS